MCFSNEYGSLELLELVRKRSGGLLVAETQKMAPPNDRLRRFRLGPEKQVLARYDDRR